MLNKGQEHVLQEAIKWWKGSEQLFQISGAPGTGKTFLLYRIIDALGIPFDKIAFMAYTGQAAIVMRNAGLTTAKTIHSTLYEPVEVPVMRPDGTCELDPYYNKPVTTVQFKPRDLSGILLFVIDEFLGGIGLILTLFIIYFFRDPIRVSPDESNVVLASADGVVDKVEEAEAPK